METLTVNKKENAGPIHGDATKNTSAKYELGSDGVEARMWKH